MAILDALTYIIQADSSKLDKEIANSEKRASDLEKGLKDVERQSIKSGMTLNDLSKAAIGYFGAFLSITKALSATASRAEFIDDISNVADSLGVAVENVDAFGQSLVGMGGDAQNARGSLSNLASAIGAATAKADSEKGKLFANLGISLRDTSGAAKDAMQVMYELAGAVEGMDRNQAIFSIKQLGISDQKTIEMILRGRQELERMMRVQRESGVITRDSAEQARRYTEAMSRLRQGLGRTGDSFLDSLIPVLTRVVEWFTTVVEWSNKHEHVIKGAMIAIAAIAIGVLAPAMKALAVSTWEALAPWLLIGLAIAAVAALFVLAYDDLMNFLEGNESLIGFILEKYPVVADIVGFLAETFTKGYWDIRNALSGAMEWTDKTVNGMIDKFTRLWQSVKEIFGWIKDTTGGAFDFIGNAYNGIKDVLSSIGEKVGFGLSTDASINYSAAQDGLVVANDFINSARSSPYNAMPMGGSRNEQSIQIDNITVQSQATDAAGISRDIKSELGNQLQSLQSEFSSGAQS